MTHRAGIDCTGYGHTEGTCAPLTTAETNQRDRGPFCAHCEGRIYETRTADNGTYTGALGTWTHIARQSELDAGLIWCETPEPR